MTAALEQHVRTYKKNNNAFNVLSPEQSIRHIDAACTRCSTGVKVSSHAELHTTYWSLFVLVALIASSAPTELAAHTGGLDASGCHTNRKTGDYHCHRSPSTSVGRNDSSNNAARTAVSRPDSRTFKNCAEARAAGAAPVRRGEPGYGPHLDRDNDGIGCER